MLQHVKETTGIGETREWTFVGCDGPPYVMASNLKESSPEEYGWLSLVPGLGHLYMNQIKTFFRVIEHIILEPLAHLLNFKSANAYEVSNFNHKPRS